VAFRQSHLYFEESVNWQIGIGLDFDTAHGNIFGQGKNIVYDFIKFELGNDGDRNFILFVFPSLSSFFLCFRHSGSSLVIKPPLIKFGLYLPSLDYAF
jgi:hypothetical protein